MGKSVVSTSTRYDLRHVEEQCLGSRYTKHARRLHSNVNPRASEQKNNGVCKSWRNTRGLLHPKTSTSKYLVPELRRVFGELVWYSATRVSASGKLSVRDRFVFLVPRLSQGAVIGFQGRAAGRLATETRESHGESFDDTQKK